MTCEECQVLAIDLARSLPPFDVGGAVQRADVLSHVATCGRCARWLRVQETLSVALRATAAADASLDAPAAVEANVMAAFRARQAQRSVSGRPSVAGRPFAGRPASERQVSARPSPLAALNADAGTPRRARAWRPTASSSTASSSTVSSFFRGSSSFRGLAGRTAAFAAAATVIIAALTMASLRRSTPAALEEPGAGSAASASASPSAPPSGAAAAGSGSAPRREFAGAHATGPAATDRPGTDPAGTGSIGTGPAGASPAVTGTNAAVLEVLPDKGRKKGPPAPPRVAAVRTARRESGGTRAIRASHVVNASRGGPEFSGPAFVLLPYVEPLRPTEMRHIMRVRMTRAQLEAGERRASGVEDSTVLADVLVGEDGTARAVRIVR